MTPNIVRSRHRQLDYRTDDAGYKTIRCSHWMFVKDAHDVRNEMIADLLLQGGNKKEKKYTAHVRLCRVPHYSKKVLTWRIPSSTVSDSMYLLK